MALRNDQFQHKTRGFIQQKLEESSYQHKLKIEKNSACLIETALLPLYLEEAIDLEICNNNTEQNESSNPSFHTPNPLLTSSPPIIPTCFPPAHWMSSLALVIARGWVTCRMAKMPKPDNLFCVSLQSLRLRSDASRGLKIQKVVAEHKGRWKINQW